MDAYKLRSLKIDSDSWGNIGMFLDELISEKKRHKETVVYYILKLSYQSAKAL